MIGVVFRLLKLSPVLPWALLAAVIGLGVSHTTVYYKGFDAGAANVQAQWDAERVKLADQAEQLQSEYRAKEQALQRDTQVISDDLHAKLDQTQTDYIVALDAVRSDRDRLRAQFRGCPAGLPSTAQAASSTGGNDGAGNGGLSLADQDVALRIGRDANRVVAKLAACQAYVNGVLQAQF